MVPRAPTVFNECKQTRKISLLSFPPVQRNNIIIIELFIIIIIIIELFDKHQKLSAP